MAVTSLQFSLYTQEALHLALSNEHADVTDVASREHSNYLFGYVRLLGAGTMVVESPYTDGDYLDDFTAYYAKCFGHFDSCCKRLHFFKGAYALDISEKIVSGTLELGDLAQLREHYLGFIVARPLPQAVIGRTVLKPFDSDGGRRYYPATRNYSANLAGIELQINRLAFQEQDTVLAACATVALWSCFQKAAALFGTTAPTPSIITKASQAFHYGRAFPSKGLSVFEMGAAIRHVGLEPEVFDLQSGGVPLLSLIYSHLQLGVPVVLGVEVPGGLHAISVVGYSLRPEAVHTKELPETSNASLPMPGLRIDRIYAHDDQIGPFCRLDVKVSPDEFPITLIRQGEEIRPTVVIAPLYHKIRLTFLDVHGWLQRLNGVVKLIFPATAHYEWDVALCFSNEYKRLVRESDVASSELKRKIVMSSQPRFIWRCALVIENAVLLDIIFDATGIARSFPVYMVSWWHEGFAEILRQLFTEPSLESKFRPVLTDRLFDLLVRGLLGDYPVACAFD